MITHKKRNLFEELKQGIEEIKAHKQGKITLRTYNISQKPRSIDAKHIRKVREELHMSRNMFALKLHVSSKTLEKWEQGIAAPNAHAVALILMAYKNPNTFKGLGNNRA